MKVKVKVGVNNQNQAHPVQVKKISIVSINMIIIIKAGIMNMIEQKE